MSEHAILPYAPLHANRKSPFLAEMETAAIACLAETRRKKRGRILRGKQEKTVSIAKLHYPMLLVPWENGYVTFDRLKTFSLEASYGKLPDFDSLVENPQKNQKSYDQFSRWLQQNAMVFKDFVGSQGVIIEGVIVDRELQDAVFEYYKTETPFKEQQTNETTFLKERLSTNEALSKVNEIADLSNKNQLDIAALQRIPAALNETAEKISNELMKNVEDIKKEYADRISQLQLAVEGKIQQLTSERNAKIKALTDSVATEIEALTKERNNLKTKLEALTEEKTRFEERKELAKLRKDTARVKRWNFSLKIRERRIAEINSQMRRLQEQITKAEEDREGNLEQTSETYETQIDAENSKITSLENLRDTKILEIQEKVNHMRFQVNNVEKDIERLVNAKNAFSSRLKEIATPWKLDAVSSVLLPFYVVEYWSESKERFEFHAPALATSSDGLMKTVKQKFLGFNLDSRISTLLRQRSRALDWMFSVPFADKVDVDRELWNHVHDLTERNNLLSSSVFKETLTKGLDRLVAEKWVKPEERSMILQAFVK